MQLILAIDGDRHQSTQLAALIRARLSVDLVQASSAGEALQLLEDRVPDLILTPALLSPFDDGVLAEYLRELGPSGAHVQTLRIPVLGAEPARKSRWSLPFRRRTPAPAASVGCDPGVFADEIGLYLTRAEQARLAVDTVVRAHESHPPDEVPTPIEQVDTEHLPAPDRVMDLEWTPPATVDAPMAWNAPQIESQDTDPVPAPVSSPSEWNLVVHDDLDDLPQAHVDVVPEPLPAEVEAPLAARPVSSSPPAGGETGSPSFEAALAAIRAAWDAPRREDRGQASTRERAVSSLG